MNRRYDPQEIKSRHDIVDVIEQYTPLKKVGSNYVCLSLFQDEKTPSLVAFPNTQSFFDFSAGVGGDVINFIQLKEGLDYKDACDHLTGNHNPTITQLKSSPAPKITKISQPERVEVYQALIDLCEPTQDEWLAENKGISLDEQRRYGIYKIKNYSRANRAMKKRFSPEQLEAAGILSSKGNLIFYKHNLLFVFWRWNPDTQQNEPIGLQGRDTTATEKNKRFLNASETPDFYNVNALHQAKAKDVHIAICEGATDTLNLNSAGIPSIGIIGMQGLKLEWLQQLKGLTVYLALDGGDKERAKALAYAERFKEAGLSEPFILPLPDGVDITEYINKGGNPEELIRNAYRPSILTDTILKTPTPEIKSDLPPQYHFYGGVPEPLIEWFLKIHQHGDIDDHASAALVYDLIHQFIQDMWVSSPEELTINIPGLTEFAKDRGRETAEKTIRKGLEQLTSAGFMIKSKEKLDDRAGRPLDVYRLIPLQKALNTFKGHLTNRIFEDVYHDLPAPVTADWFPEDDHETAQQKAETANAKREQVYQENSRPLNKAKYRMTGETLRMRNSLSLKILNRSTKADYLIVPSDQRATVTWEHGQAFVDDYYRHQALRRSEREENISVKEAAAQIGRSPATLKVIRKRVGISTERQYAEKSIRDSQNVATQANELFPFAANRKYGRWLMSSSGKQQPISIYAPDGADLFARTEMKEGHVVTVRVEIPSQERPATDKEIEANKRREAHKQKLQQAQKEWDKTFGKEEKPSPRKKPTLPPVQETMPNGLSTRFIWRQLRTTFKSDEEFFTFLTPLKKSDLYRGTKKEKIMPSDEFYRDAILDLGAVLSEPVIESRVS